MNVISLIKDLGVAGGVGALIGIILVFYIEPTEAGGIALLVAIPIMIATIIGVLLRGKGKEKEGKDKPNNVGSP
jgi:hypothetical protein